MVAETVQEVCGQDPSALCRWVYDWTGSGFAAEASVWLVDRPLRVGLILIAGWVASRAVRRSIRRFGDRVVERGRKAHEEFERQRRPGEALDPEANARSMQRAETLTSVLVSMGVAAVWVVVTLMAMGQVGVSVAPLLAGAGVVGVMLAFGAQNVVADFLAGIFMLIEDQYGVGDVVDVGDVTGTVETVSLRVTTLRDVSGTVWHVPNSQIQRVANHSQIWSRAVLDIEVSYDTDLRRAQQIMQDVADGVWKDTEFQKGDIIEPPEVWGVQDLGADGIALRLVVKTDPSEQWAVARELRLRIKEAFDQAGIEIPFPQRTVWVRQGNTP